jgi:hypothetical protein
MVLGASLELTMETVKKTKTNYKKIQNLTQQLVAVLKTMTTVSFRTKMMMITAARPMMMKVKGLVGMNTKSRH